MRKKFVTLSETERKYTELRWDPKNCIVVPSYKGDGTALIVETIHGDEGNILAYFRYMADASGKAISEVTNSLYPKKPNSAEYFNQLGSVGYKKVLLEHLKTNLEIQKEEIAEMVR